MGSLSLLQGIFPTQRSNPGLLHSRQILYQLSHQGSPRILECIASPFSSGSSPPRNPPGVSCIAGGFLTSGATREAPLLHFLKFLLFLMHNELCAQSCSALCDPRDWDHDPTRTVTPPGSSVRGILQARTLEWAVMPFSRGSSQPRDRTQVSRIAGRCFNL